jgi:hypothetical protein
VGITGISPSMQILNRFNLLVKSFFILLDGVGSGHMKRAQSGDGCANAVYEQPIRKSYSDTVERGFNGKFRPGLC